MKRWNPYLLILGGAVSNTSSQEVPSTRGQHLSFIELSDSLFNEFLGGKRAFIKGDVKPHRGKGKADL
jgi:hypothetical protein